MHLAAPQREIRPAGWLASLFLFAVPAIVFASLFHWAGPILLNENISWWRIFHWLLILPLTLMLLSAIVGAALDVPSTSWSLVAARLRLTHTDVTTWLWAGALSGFMFGGSWQDVLAIAVSWLALWRENHRRVWEFVAIPAVVFFKRNASIFQPLLQRVRFFDPSDFYHGFFNRFGPREFMGVPLHGAWWILVYYALIMFVCNIGGEELWWRGYVLPRQELAFGRATWVIHGLLWSAFHLFMQPTLWDTVRMAITGMALCFVAQRTRSTWPGIIGHSFGNLAFFLNLVHGVMSA